MNENVCVVSLAVAYLKVWVLQVVLQQLLRQIVLEPLSLSQETQLAGLFCPMQPETSVGLLAL